jgi:hypothetical protein
LFLLAWRHQDVARGYAESLAGLGPAALAGAFSLVLAQVTLQSLRFWSVLPPRMPLRVVEAAHVFTVGDWTNTFAPARGGDLLKVMLMRRVAADRVLDRGEPACGPSRCGCWRAFPASGTRSRACDPRSR